MNHNLLTYDSVVTHNAGYAANASAKEFAETLLKLTKQFATKIGVKEEDVFWWQVTDSDWCNRMLIIYASVPTDWKPLKDTYIYNDSPSTHRPELVFNLSSWIKGRGERVNINVNPPREPHKLFHSKKAS